MAQGFTFLFFRKILQRVLFSSAWQKLHKTHSYNKESYTRHLHFWHCLLRSETLKISAHYHQSLVLPIFYFWHTSQYVNLNKNTKAIHEVKKDIKKKLAGDQSLAPARYAIRCSSELSATQTMVFTYICTLVRKD